MSCERDHKPGSVLDGHLSRPRVTARLKRSRGTRRAADLPPLHLAPGGVYSADLLPGSRVSSYLAFPSLPSRRTAVYFCCTLPGVASAGR